MNKDTVKSIISLLLGLSPLLFLGCFHQEDYFIEKYKDLLLATSIPGFLFFGCKKTKTLVVNKHGGR